MPVRARTSLDADCCPVCLSRYVKSVRLVCDHAICASCFSRFELYVKKGVLKGVCPLCRRDLSIAVEPAGDMRRLLCVFLIFLLFVVVSAMLENGKPG